MRFDEKNWYQPSLTWAAIVLLPLAGLFGLITAVRRWCYRHHLFKSTRFNLPVIIVGNITIGGTGKTPCVIALAQYLQSQGFHPGIVSRGVGGRRHHQPMVVTSTSNADEVGDEALLLARESKVGVVISADRVAAVHALLRFDSTCDVVISDDGLQHYRLQRDIEIVVVDGERQFGNGCLLPSGPLREPLSRLKSVNYVLINGGTRVGAFTMNLQPNAWVSVGDPSLRLAMPALSTERVHAIAGIGHPARFFNLLQAQGFTIVPHAFPDHHPFIASDLSFDDRYAVLMTGKDAVKCEAFADERMWYLDITATIDPQLLSRIKDDLQGAKSR
jgi:tetraacyldisaccharide 4'-kinase